MIDHILGQAKPTEKKVTAEELLKPDAGEDALAHLGHDHGHDHDQHHDHDHGHDQITVTTMITITTISIMTTTMATITTISTTTTMAGEEVIA